MEFVLEIPEDLCNAMVEHCFREAPLEACGILGGVAPRVSSLHPCRNRCASETHYEADPRDVIVADRELRKRNAKMLAIYHSHPKWPAIPSKTDLKRNYHGDTPRIIVSLEGPTPVIRVWRLDEKTYAEIPWRRVDAE